MIDNSHWKEIKSWTGDSNWLEDFIATYVCLLVIDTGDLIKNQENEKVNA